MRAMESCQMSVEKKRESLGRDGERAEHVHMNNLEELKEREDFYFDEHGLFILTKKYLENRGACCKLNCRNCPYGFRK
jgi:hypothetical protein